MPYQPDSPLDESLDPIVEAVGRLRACCETLRLLLDEIERNVVGHLELFDALIRTSDGSRQRDRVTPAASRELGGR